MNFQTTDTKGIYAGLSPADFVMKIRRPSLGEKLKSAALLSNPAIGSDRAGATHSNPTKA